MTAPGTDIEAELSRRTHIALYFKGSDYAFVDEPMLERALTSIARLLWVGWQRQYRRALEYTNLSIDAEDATDLAFLADRDATRAVGESSDGRITIGTLGMRKFAVRIEPGTVRELTEIEFCAGVSEAAGNVIHVYQTKVGALKRRYYD
ncbi:hypothetical protein KO481_29365 [Nocardia sp. NEAU-G5]|uniref:Uncharacterized protein n=1 Tax=Nocardia albiluteola TaxID=2842303 RepID=A0ABS6B8T4_9NOCA|nr:hypothetical protein [Nocardia albiluteola]MBU3065623.1 hypothetical protein [Nocardia albiluteola]